MDLKAYLDLRRPLVESKLNELLPSEREEPATLHRAMRYSALGGGKRFRPILCIAAAEACGGSSDAVLEASCAIEMVHCFSLIHDDLPALDNDDLRRGKPTCHVVFGEAVAILAGDALFSLAFQTLSGIDVSDPAKSRAISALAFASGTDGMVGGQIVDIESHGKQVTLESVEWIHQRKTGALIAAACEIGAIVGGGSEGDVDRCKRAGERIGLAFQITDDVLDEISDSESLGKTAGKDREACKATYPSVMGIERSMALAKSAADEAVQVAESFGDGAIGLRLLARYSVERVR
ncbi:MAG: polyprenyl synthetase family protein [Fimbriimonadales bacterium]|nr:polyprenyl synthetase family protein [Fimbriimonadales bacterium]